MADTIESGGLPTSDTPAIKATEPTTKGISLGGLKNVSLNPDQSSEIRDRLMQMISQREAQKGGFDASLEYLTSFGGNPRDFVTNQRNYREDVAKREQDLFNMRAEVASLNTQDARIKQAQDQKTKDDAIFYQLLGGNNQSTAAGGAAPQPPAAAGGLPQAAGTPQAGGLPQAGGAPQQPAPGGLPQAGGAPQAGGLPQAGGAPRPAATQGTEPTAELFALYRQDPKAAMTKLIEMRKMDEVQKRLVAAGVQPGSDQWNQALFLNVAGAGAFNPQDVRTPTGTVQQTPWTAAGQTLQPGAPAPAPAPAPVTTGAPAAVAPRPAAVAPRPAAVAAPSTGFAPGSVEDLAVRKQAALVPVEGATTEARGVAEKISVPEQQDLSTRAANAANDLTMSARIAQNVKAYPTLVGKLSKPTIASALMNVADKGVQLPNGSISFPAVNDFATQLDPDMVKIKDPAEREKRMTAARQLATDFATLQLRGSQVIKGQGSVSDNERRLVGQAVGDFTRLTPSNVMTVAKVLELEAHNAREKSNLWAHLKGKTTWQDFKNTPEYKQLEKDQFYRTAGALNIKDAKWVD